MRFGTREIALRAILGGVWHDLNANHTMTMAAGLSYYFVLSLFPMLILLAAMLAYLPIPHLFDAMLGALAHVVPTQSMGLVRRVVATVATPHGGLLTFGIVGTLWTASSGFSALIEALNVAYNVPETRPMWKTRLLAVGLMFWFAILIGAELNAELVKAMGAGKLELKQKPPEAVKPVEPWAAKPAA